MEESQNCTGPAGGMTWGTQTSPRVTHLCCIPGMLMKVQGAQVTNRNSTTNSRTPQELWAHRNCGPGSFELTVSVAQEDLGSCLCGLGSSGHTASVVQEIPGSLSLWHRNLLLGMWEKEILGGACLEVICVGKHLAVEIKLPNRRHVCTWPAS